MSYLIAGEDPKGLHHLLGRVGIGRLASHEVKEGVECDKAGAVGVYYCHYSLEVRLTLP